MSRASERYQAGIPTKPYDLLREGLIVLALVTVVVIILAIILGSPDYPTVTIQEVAKKQPIAYLKLTSDYLSGNSDLQTYGPPYTNNPENAQTVLGFISPQRWFGVTNPVNAQKDFVLTPLKKVAEMDPTVAAALTEYDRASDTQKSTWVKNFTDALDKATVNGNTVALPKGDYGPVAAMMNGMLNLGRSGLMEGALAKTSQLPYSLDNTKVLLFLGGDIEENVAGSLDMQGGEWGIGHETGNYPGAWWLWPYTFLYQIPAIADSPNADLIVGLVIGLFVLLLIFLPVIPGLNRIPHGLKVYRLIWRDWYKRTEP
ncbi:MAG TPA: hypothetical protein VMW69_00420 [Spirochaetia bacterium]|nr:hypothetical protein [Spirochaetia bacterium]